MKSYGSYQKQIKIIESKHFTPGEKEITHEMICNVAGPTI